MKTTHTMSDREKRRNGIVLFTGRLTTFWPGTLKMKNTTLEDIGNMEAVNGRFATPTDIDRPTAIFWCFLFILEALVIFVGNLLTAVVFLRNRKLRNKRYYMMINLAISDTLVGALAIPMFVVAFGDRQQLWSIISLAVVPYDVQLFFDMFAGFASIAFLAIIALERLYATLRPFNYRALKSHWYILFTVIAWIAAGFVPSLHIVALKFPKVFHSSHAITISMWVPFLSALLLLICVSYVVIWGKGRAVHKSVRKRDMEKESSLSRICLLVTAVSLVAWLPFVIANLMFSVQGLSLQLFYATKFLHFANSLLNPVLYVLKIPEFKEGLSNLCRRNRAHSTSDVSVPLSTASPCSKSTVCSKRK